ncbi:MAG TPA: Asp23/Gls24 family envelope stress response protein [Thermomicrobiales bacterium]|nr:Asp23/Gls24 family envelope stress response protein [Thermomicrobiales bacterium]
MDNGARIDRPGHGAATDVQLGTASGQPARFGGTVRIAPAVLIQLIDLTLLGVEGFSGLRNHDARPVPDGVPGKQFSNGKIAVTVDGDQIAVSIGCSIDRNANVVSFSAAVQRAIGFAVGNMLNMTVKSVDLIIQDVTATADS